MPGAASEPRVVRTARLAVRAVATALRVLEGESVRLRAMALTYISLFALVPALVVAFSVVQAFTGMDRIAQVLHEFLFENLAVGARDTLQPHLLRFVTNAHATSAGLVGGAFLVWSAVSLFSNVEDAINDIWGVRRRRARAQQAVIYWVGLTLGPLLLAGSVMLAGAARTALADAGVKTVAALGGAVLTCTFFSLIYLLVPNTKVRLRAAVLGGVTAGLVWELAKWGYALGVGKIFRYHAIYGSVAAVPIFIFWLFVSWTIVLFGARLAFVVQYATLLLRRAPRASSRAEREILAGEVMLAVARAFDGADAPPDAAALALRVGGTAEDVSSVTSSLRQAGLLLAVGEGAFVPARSLDRITLLDVRRAVLGDDPPPTGRPGSLGEIVRETEDQAAARLAGVSFRRLCDGERSAGSDVAAPATSGAERGAARAGTAA